MEVSGNDAKSPRKRSRLLLIGHVLLYVSALAAIAPHYLAHNLKAVLEFLIYSGDPDDLELRQRVSDFKCEGDVSFIDGPEQVREIDRQRREIGRRLRGALPDHQLEVDIDPQNVFFGDLDKPCNVSGVQLRLRQRSFIILDNRLKPAAGNAYSPAVIRTLRHELAHVGQQPSAMRWLKEVGADRVSGRERTAQGVYWIAHLWWRFLCQRIEERGIADSGETILLEQVYLPEPSQPFSEAFLQQLLADLPVPEGERQLVLEMLHDGGMEGLWLGTRKLLAMNPDGSWWEGELGMTAQQMDAYFLALQDRLRTTHEQRGCDYEHDYEKISENRRLAAERLNFFRWLKNGAILLLLLLFGRDVHKFSQRGEKAG